MAVVSQATQRAVYARVRLCVARVASIPREGKRFFILKYNARGVIAVEESGGRSGAVMGDFSTYARNDTRGERDGRERGSFGVELYHNLAEAAAHNCGERAGN